MAASEDDGRKNGPRLRSPRESEFYRFHRSNYGIYDLLSVTDDAAPLKIDGNNIEALLKRISTLTQVTGSCMYSKEREATLDADAEVAKFHDALL